MPNKKINKNFGAFMDNNISNMTKEELIRLIEIIVENKIFEMFKDPDEGLELKDEVKERLKLLME